ncbi:MAG: transporter [Desulfobulbaceae bacterium]|nr:transporter [Desulfobulbaceae bacterium]
MRKQVLLAVALSVLTMAASSIQAVFAAIPPQFSLGLGVDYARGNFGTDSTSTYTTVPLILDWYPNQRFKLELTVPFLDQSTSNTGYAASGNGIAAAQYAGKGRGLNQSGTKVVVSSSEDQSGFGDITMEASYNLLLDGATLPDLGLICYLKFPTADADKGLGTGAFDWGPGLRLAKWLGDWQPFLEGRYIFQGASSAQTGARDYLLADVGLGYGWNENLYFAGFSRLGSASFEEMSAPREARLKTVWGFGENSSLEAYLLKGLSHGSPDLGGGISFFVGF